MTFGVNAAATREEKRRRRKRIRVRIGRILSGGREPKGEGGVGTSEHPGIYLDSSGGRNAGMRMRLSISIPRLQMGSEKVQARLSCVTVEYEWTLSDPLETIPSQPGRGNSLSKATWISGC